MQNNWKLLTNPAGVELSQNTRAATDIHALSDSKWIACVVLYKGYLKGLHAFVLRPMSVQSSYSHWSLLRMRRRKRWLPNAEVKLKLSTFPVIRGLSHQWAPIIMQLPGIQASNGTQFSAWIALGMEYLRGYALKSPVWCLANRWQVRGSIQPISLL